jgi:hypothetical protein
VSTNEVKWSESPRKRVSIIIRRYTNHMKFYCFFHILLVLMSFTVYTVVRFVCFCLILYIIYPFCHVYVFLLLLCMSVLSIAFHCVVVCTVCVSMCTVLLPPGVNPIAVNKYILSHIVMKCIDFIYSRTLDCEQLGLRVFYKTSKNFEGILT